MLRAMQSKACASYKISYMVSKVDHENIVYMLQVQPSNSNSRKASML